MKFLLIATFLSILLSPLNCMAQDKVSKTPKENQSSEKQLLEKQIKIIKQGADHLSAARIPNNK